jgi:serine/threonine protein phosphatase PrpC
MGLKIADHAGTTDVGRQRSSNEDSLVCEPPLFAVADGMGGARAGEVASQLAVEVLEEDTAEAAGGMEAHLAELVREANRRIYELSTDDESRRGMGTTLTAAKLHGSEVSLAHVGDSRAYRLRDGTLEQLTNDHSLVAELERSGQITPEAAEHHPQRSIITRALGPEPDVEVDTYTLQGREGDVFLLCSDGLTGMISDEEVASILRGAGRLEEAAAALVRAANQSGGKDNITVVLFRLEHGGGDEAGTDPAADETVAGGITATDVAAEADAGQRPTPAAVAVKPREEPAPAAPPGREARLAEPPPPEPLPPSSPRRAPPPRRRGGRVRLALKTLFALALLAAVATGLYAASRQVYFVGTNDAGLVTLYRGLPYDLPFGIELYEEEYASGVPARAIPRTRRAAVLDHSWRWRRDARDLVRQLERGKLDAGGAAG